MTLKNWNPEAAGKAAGLAERGGGPNEAITVRRPHTWKLGTKVEQADRNRRGARNGKNSVALRRKLDAVLGPVEGDE